MLKLLRVTALAAVLAVFGLVVPDSAVHPTDLALVKLKQAEGVDATSKKVVWMLFVGSDARPGDDMTHARGDALQLVGVNTETHAAAAIGIPRDSWVPIAGHGYNRVNSSLYFGGPQLLGQTVGDLVGVQPQYVFITRFPYFQNMIHDIGGITVHNPRAFSDTYLKPKGFPKGKIHLNGYEAMAFSRIRHNLPGGDFDRSADQQRVLRGVAARIRARQAAPGFMERGVQTVMSNMATNVGPADLFRLAQLAAEVDPSKITNCVVQGSIGNISGMSIVHPYVSQARSYGNAARNDATLGRC